MINFSFNIPTIASVVIALIAIMSYIRQVRINDLTHIDTKLDAANKRIDDLYKLMVEKK